MNDTPETDGEWNRIACYEHPQFEQGIADFARKLERERDILRKHISIMDISHKTANDEYFKLAVENEKLERERDKYYNELLTKRGLCKVQEQVISDWKAEAEKWRAIANDNRN